ncbi:hypothetical protein ACQ31_gp144 [Salmonella phage STML-198]|uniref:Uncharacterized protein n=2 Tax=Gelderlandvirus TaxID=1913653 RepID=K4I420_9CAUD|nr:hypothetical protein ACQ31_gp144 [Salmonella phage STML-198]YP_009615562.1 hypothetical protein FDI73_gp076 [Salmonella phage Melville]AFU64027.1 hypothetical protein [Salmonella phage STML-198]ATN93050.1 hypothetical protein CPT_Melville_076 [Salmonella phage Melville]UPW42451.1 hypothetical protein EBPHNEJP_00153 [Salmonella phage CF-SP2]
MNPFSSSDAMCESEEMKSLFKELRKLHAEIIVQHTIDAGEKTDINFIHNCINAATAFDVIYFKYKAHQKFIKNPYKNISDRIYLAASDAYYEVITE